MAESKAGARVTGKDAGEWESAGSIKQDGARKIGAPTTESVSMSTFYTIILFSLVFTSQIPVLCSPRRHSSRLLSFRTYVLICQSSNAGVRPVAHRH